MVAPLISHLFEHQAQQESAELQKEAAAVGAELRRTEILVQEQEEGGDCTHASGAHSDDVAFDIRLVYACLIDRILTTKYIRPFSEVSGY